MGNSGKLSRREALVAGAVGLAGLTAGSSGDASAAVREPRMPVTFVPHGGGPWPFVNLMMGSPEELAELARYLTSLAQVPRTAPKAILMVSAHWEERHPTVSTAERPSMLFDYYGFPPESYRLTWPAPGNPRLARRVRDLLGKAGFETGEDRDRGFDHGTFVPLKLAWPKADVPTVQLSLERGLDPERHLAMGRALAPLRDEGVYIVGSGMTFHDLRSFGSDRAGPVSEEFDAWLRAAGTSQPAERDRLLAAWSKAPSARQAHPREEHLLPLMVIAGAAGNDRGSVAWQGTVMGAQLSAYQFG